MRSLCLTRSYSSSKDGLRVVTGLPEKQSDRIAVIYRPPKNAMQSGIQNTKKVQLGFVHRGKWTNPLMGYASSADPLGYLKLNFDSFESAIAYCKDQGLKYRVETDPVKPEQGKSYADNFKFDDGTEKLTSEKFW